MKQKEEKQIEEEVKGENIFSTEWKNKQDKNKQDFSIEQQFLLKEKNSICLSTRAQTTHGSSRSYFLN